MKQTWLILVVVPLLFGLNFLDAKPLPKVGESLRLKFTKGVVYFLEMETMTEQKMKVMDQDVNQNQEQTVVIQVSPEALLDDGDWLVGVQVVGMKMKINIGGNKVEFDSTKNEPASPMVSSFDAIVKTQFKATFGPNGELKRFIGRDEMLKKLAIASPGQDGPLKSLLTESALKKMFTPIGDFLPDRPGRVGTHWNRQGEVDLGPVGKYVYDHQYTYHDTIREVHEIRAKTTMKFQPPPKNNGALPFAIVAVKATKSVGQGAYHFDASIGRLKESVHELQFKATMQIRIGNMNSDIELEQKQTTKARSFDRNPFQSK